MDLSIQESVTAAEPAPVARGKAAAALQAVDELLKESGVFWRATMERLGKLTKEKIEPSAARKDLHDWLPDLNAHVEAQFDNKKQWYSGKVTQINADDTMSVRFNTNVTEANMPPHKVRLTDKKMPKPSKRYRTSPTPVESNIRVGDIVACPFEHQIDPKAPDGYPGVVVKINDAEGSCDVTFKFNANVTEHGIPLSKCKLQLQMHDSLKPYKSVLEKIMRRDEARDFQRPVKDLWPAESIPGYFDVVKKPMDLGTVKKKLMSGQYNDKPQDLVADTKLVFTNCMLYTQVSSPHYYHMAEKMLGIVTEAYANVANGNGGGGAKRKASSGQGGAQAMAPPAKRPAQMVAAPPMMSRGQKRTALIKEIETGAGRGAGLGGGEVAMAHEAQEVLLEQLLSMNDDDMQAAIDMIKTVEDIGDDTEIDLGGLRASTLWKLRKYVDEMKTFG